MFEGQVALRLDEINVKNLEHELRLEIKWNTLKRVGHHDVVSNVFIQNPYFFRLVVKKSHVCDNGLTRGRYILVFCFMPLQGHHALFYCRQMQPC